MIQESKLDLLIISDLHLSEGRDPQTKKFSPNEDFFFDEEFARFLAYYRRQAKESGRKLHLIINGDFVDFLQVTSLPKPDRPELKRDRPEYGLACGEEETVFKLGVIVNGHWQFFEALAEFLAEGHKLGISKGNHDVEFHYAKVQAALRDELWKLYAQKSGGAAGPGEKQWFYGEGIEFYDWFYYEKDLLWVEHGNQYDKLNNFKFWLAPLLPDLKEIPAERREEIDLPWGSLFVRYLFNRVETAVPFADNIKPQTKFIGWFVRHLYVRRHLVQALKFLFEDGRYMLRKMRRAWQPVPANAYQRREEAHEKRLRELAVAARITPELLKHIDGERARSVLKEIQETTWGWKFFRALIRSPISYLLLMVLLVLVAIAKYSELWSHLAPLLPGWLGTMLWDSWKETALGHIFLRALWLVRWLLLLLLVVAPASFFKWLLWEKKEPGLSYLARKARLIAEKLRVRYVIMGHTHDTDLQAIGRSDEEYFNTGTWTKVFSQEERLVREESELVYAHVARRAQGVRIKLLKWNDAANQPRLVKLFEAGKPRARKKPCPPKPAPAKDTP